MRIAVVGAGRVGVVLGAAFRQAGHDLAGVSAVSDSARRRAAALLPGVPVRRTAELAADCELLLLAVPDDRLSPLVAELAAGRAVGSGTLIAHTSGRFGTEVLLPAARAGGGPLALHPVMSFTGTAADLARLPGACFGVTVPDRLWPVADRLVRDLGGQPVPIAEEHRALYHAALVIGSNYLMVVVAWASDLLRRCGVADPARLLGPLTIASLDNVLREGDPALTGPVARGDTGTVAAHLAALAALPGAGAAVYAALAGLTAERAIGVGLLSRPRADELRDVLSGGEPAA